MKACILALLLTCTITAQRFTPIDTADYEQRTELSEVYEESFESFNRSLKKQYKGDLRKAISSYYESSQVAFLKLLRKREIVFDDRYTAYIESLSERLKQQNTGDDLREYRILLSRSNEPNAFCLPDGTIVVHIGLFRLLENDEQFLSVICHELAHNELRHPEQTFADKARVATSDKLKDQVNKINKRKYQQNQQAFALLKDILYSQGKVRRRQEMEADSVGLLLFQKVSKHPREFINALAFIKEIDSLPAFEISKQEFEGFFNVPEQAFNQEWWRQDDYSNYNYALYEEKIDKDSLISHPEMSLRIDKLKNDHPILDKGADLGIAQKGSKFLELKQLAEQEVIHNYYNLEEYGKSTYIALARLANSPEDQFLRNWLGINLDRLYEAKKDYQLNKYLEHITKDLEDESYRRFLTLMWNLELNELKVLAEYYTSDDE